MKRLLCLLLILPVAAFAADYPDPTSWTPTMRGFALEDEIADWPRGAIVATGSSSMRFWDHRIHEDLAPLTIISRGFGGSNMNDLLYFLDELVLKHAPRAVMIYEGDNDVAQGVPVSQILSRFESAIVRIHAADPETRVYLLSVKPSILRAAMWPEMLQVNAGLQRLAGANDNVHYIDVATPMMKDDGNVREDLFVQDGLHMNQKGYDIWRNVVAPVLVAGEIRYE